MNRSCKPEQQNWNLGNLRTFSADHYFVSARSFKCTFEPARSKFYKSFNAIFGKVGSVASESVIMQLISSKCLPVLLYATEVCPFLACDQSSVSFAVTRVLMKIFRTRSRDVTEQWQCQIVFGMLPVEHHVFLRKVWFLLFRQLDLFAISRQRI